jgi:RNA polymerase sigma factor
VASVQQPRRPEGAEATDVGVLVSAAQAGDGAARERLIAEFRGLVLRVGARVCGRYLRMGRDDEISVGLLALNEAIDRYRAEVGASFAAFAEMVVRRRLIDQFRRESARREVPQSSLEREDEEGGRWEAAEWHEAQEIDRARREAEDRRAEIGEFLALLRPYGVTLRDLVAQSPQHADARARAVAVARRIVANPEWTEHLRKRRSLPLRELEAVPDLGVSRKTLERQRKFIIAVAVILMEGLHALRGYLPEAE